ncbi:MSC domain-containing protein [Cephalotus follicularis]|uniref:MSC domain-containing protein n=1 Tax=Cephalotus follicularis TaxID=3775 RepID=A0A1Q3DCT7_CEPFO|nr:MSC domain-containing protein [Cephalotus follicularis]
MSPTPRKRLKHKPTSSSSSTSSISLMEPPKSMFPSKAELLRLMAVLAIASSVALACNFLLNFLNSTPKPFCDTLIIDPLDSISDSCQPCPSNGQCYQGKLECVHGYREHGNLCVEDGDINETAKKLSEWIESRLCEAYAQLLCDATGTAWTQEEDIWNDLDRHELLENFGSDNSAYLYTKSRTMGTIDSLLETRINSFGIKEFKCLDSVAEYYKPFTCRIRQWISRHVFVIVPVFALLVACTLLLVKVHQRWYLATRVEELYRQVCDILEENAVMSNNLNGKCESWLVASHLRDHLLLPRERKDPVLWKKVEELVQEDSRVDRYPKLVKGESKVVWEWQVAGSLRSSATRKTREGSKLTSGEGLSRSTDQQSHTSKTEPKALIF